MKFGHGGGGGLVTHTFVFGKHFTCNGQGHFEVTQCTCLKIGIEEFGPSIVLLAENRTSLDYLRGHSPGARTLPPDRQKGQIDTSCTRMNHSRHQAAPPSVSGGDRVAFSRCIVQLPVVSNVSGRAYAISDKRSQSPGGANAS